MNLPKATIKNIWPYRKDKMNLPVRDLETALPFYKTKMGFEIVENSRKVTPHPLVALEKDGIQIGLAENGGDPEQDGCFFEVENVEQAFAELKANGLKKEISEIQIQKHGDTPWKVFFVVAPDGLCYCYGERQSDTA